MAELKVGDAAPAIQGVDQNGAPISLDQYAGKKVVLYFYPKDNTPGCTAEACDLRDHYSHFLDQGMDVIGVSADSEKSHQNFISKIRPALPPDLRHREEGPDGLRGLGREKELRKDLHGHHQENLHHR